MESEILYKFVERALFLMQIGEHVVDDALGVLGRDVLWGDGFGKLNANFERQTAGQALHQTFAPMAEIRSE